MGKKLSQNRARTMEQCLMVKYTYKRNPRRGWGGHKTTMTIKLGEIMADTFPKLMTETEDSIRYQNQRI